MPVALFVVATAGPPIGEAAHALVAERVRGLAGLLQGALYRPLATAPDTPFRADGSGPALALELRFAGLGEAEAALTPWRLGRLAEILPEVAFEHQLFAARDFPVPEAEFGTEEPCTFLVHYPGPSDDADAWLEHYDAHHPAIMARFPGVRQVATYRPVAWSGGLDWRRGRVMQRNKVAFDSPAALQAALASPVMAEMRADRDRFPPFEGGAAHFPMRTRFVV